jgi:hypothetical protein
MSTLTIRLSATKHQRLKDFARARGVSLNKLVEEWATVALAQLDAENHYHPGTAIHRKGTNRDTGSCHSLKMLAETNT